jgi:dipeptidyl aminopeptidase/acylaminoacyl peptidase
MTFEPQVQAYNFRVSPNGQAIAYVSNQSTRPETYLAPMANLAQVTLVSRGFGQRPLWSPDNRKLYYITGGRMMEVDVDLSVSPITVSAPRQTFNQELMSTIALGDYYTSTNWDISPDGKHFVMIRGIPPDPSAPPDPNDATLVVISNVFAELRQKLPHR